MSIQTPPTEDASVETVDHQLSIATDDLFHLLQNSRRRALLRYFAAHPERETFDMRTIAEAIATWENETTKQELTSDQRQRVYIALYQSHLPKLDDYGIIEYNQPRGTIVPTPLTAVFEPYLQGTFDDAPVDQRVTVPDDESSLGSTVRSLLNR